MANSLPFGLCSSPVKLTFGCSHSTRWQGYLMHFHLIRQKLFQINPSDALLALGNFNLTDVFWKFYVTGGYFDPFLCSRYYDEVIALVFELCLCQLDCISNTLNKFLDLVFCNKTNLFITPIVNIILCHLTWKNVNC